MCDCYWAECVVCKRLIPVHIMDFLTPRENIEVFCGRHLPKQDCFVWRWGETKAWRLAGFRIINRRRIRWRFHRKSAEVFRERYPNLGLPPYQRPPVSEVAKPNSFEWEFVEAR